MVTFLCLLAGRLCELFSVTPKSTVLPSASSSVEHSIVVTRFVVPERPKGGGHLAAMNCVGKLQRDLHQCCGILVKPLSPFFGHPPFDFIFKFLLMAFFSHDLGQLSHPFPLSLPATFIASPILTNIQQTAHCAGYICLCCSALQNCCLYVTCIFFFYRDTQCL